MVKGKYKYYIAIWALIVVSFNIIVFIIPRNIGGVDRYTGSFWVGYAFIMLMLVAQLGVGWMVFKEENLTKVFYKISLLSISFSSMIIMGIVGMICMAIPVIPVWLGVIACLLVFVFSGVSFVSAQAAVSAVEEIDKKVKVKTFFIKSLTVDVEMLKEKATLSDIKNEIGRLYDVVRYSDPMSDDALTGIETQITLKMSDLSEAVGKSDLDAVKKISKDVTLLVTERNKKCKLLK